MRKLLNNPKVVAVLAVVAVLYVGYSVYPKKAAQRPAAVSPGAEAVSAEAEALEAVSGEESSSIAPQDAMAALLALSLKPRDPFALPKTPVAADSAPKADLPDVVDQLHLSAIWTQGAQTWLLVNGRIARTGEAVGRITIETATREGVWLKHWKGRNFVTVGERFELKTPAAMLANLAAH